MKYPTPTLNALPDGAILDQRFKLAVELAKVPGYYQLFLETTTPVLLTEGVEQAAPPVIEFARFCADLAGTLYATGTDLGWITPLPDSSDVPSVEMAHVQRAAAANVHGQIHAQRVGAEEQSRVQRASGGFLNG